jgi:hypothetical protein
VVTAARTLAAGWMAGHCPAERRNGAARSRSTQWRRANCSRAVETLYHGAVRSRSTQRRRTSCSRAVEVLYSDTDNHPARQPSRLHHHRHPCRRAAAAMAAAAGEAGEAARTPAAGWLRPGLDIQRTHPRWSSRLNHHRHPRPAHHRALTLRPPNPANHRATRRQIWLQGQARMDRFRAG